MQSPSGQTSCPFYQLYNYFIPFSYRVSAIAILCLFFQTYVLIPLLLIVTFNTVSFKLLGLDLPRSLVYGICSLTAPVSDLSCNLSPGFILFAVHPSATKLIQGSSSCNASVLH